jgi:hypothetical protein
LRDKKVHFWRENNSKYNKQVLGKNSPLRKRIKAIYRLAAIGNNDTKNDDFVFVFVFVGILKSSLKRRHFSLNISFRSATDGKRSIILASFFFQTTICFN